jgi:hypothetical protein
MYPPPGGNGGYGPGADSQQIANEVMRRQEEQLRRRQEGMPPGENPAQMPDPRAQQPQWQPPPPAFPQNQPAPPPTQPVQPEPGYPQPPQGGAMERCRAEPAPRRSENGGFPPR